MLTFKCTYTFLKRETVTKFVSGNSQREVFHDACIEANGYGDRCTGVEVVLYNPLKHE